jgi:hypothetical protein
LFSRDHRPTEAIWQREEPVDEAKPYKIPKREVWEAFKRVKANQGAAGVDGQSTSEFEANLSDNLYKLWNRLSSGSYFPPPVRRVDIPKADGGMRPLGIPTVADRIGQEVVRRYLEPILEPEFHPDSYGYRPGKSAIDAVQTRSYRPNRPGSSFGTTRLLLPPPAPLGLFQLSVHGAHFRSQYLFDFRRIVHMVLNRIVEHLKVLLIHLFEFLKGKQVVHHRHGISP